MTIETETLKFINEVRALIGKDPLDHIEKAVPGPPALTCPVASSIGAFHHNGGFYISVVWKDRMFFSTSGCGFTTDHHKDSPCVVLPEGVQEFINKYDKGELPSYLPFLPEL